MGQDFKSCPINFINGRKGSYIKNIRECMED